MAVNNSDRNGRALECAVVNELSKIPNATLTPAAIRDNARDKPKLDEIYQEEPQLYKQYITAAEKISNWISSQFTNQNITINRLPDSKTSVVDIAIASDTNYIQISLKHNHLALKHPRPYSFAQACGYKKDTKKQTSANDLSHRTLMKAVDNSFRAFANGKQNYNECDLSNLYKDVYKACEASINNWSNDTNLAKNLFGFIVNSGFYKVIVNTGSTVSVTVQDFLSIAAVNKVNASTQSKYLTLTFDNGWEISLRVHSAATKISTGNSQLSLKFDAQKVAGQITEIKL